jgi:hypothetical protein
MESMGIRRPTTSAEERESADQLTSIHTWKSGDVRYDMDYPWKSKWTIVLVIAFRG